MAISDEPDFDGAFRDVELACLPAPVDRIAEELIKLRVVSAVKDGADIDMEIQAGAYADRLSRYPADCVIYVLRQWPSESKWWPTWFELEEKLSKWADERTVLLKDIPSVQRQWESDR